MQENKILKEESLMLRSSIAGYLSRGDRFYPTSGLNPNDPVDKCPAFYVLAVLNDQIYAIAETPIPCSDKSSTTQQLCEDDLSDYRHQLENTGVIVGRINKLRLPTAVEYIWAQDLNLHIQEPGELTGSGSSDYGAAPKDGYDPLLYIGSDNRFYNTIRNGHDTRPFYLRPFLALNAKTLVLVDDPENKLYVELSD